jgi:hypothetical protein
VWNDFEDTWRGPIEWDLAVLARTTLLDGSEALAAYPGPFDADLVELCREIRWLQVQIWKQASVRRHPDRKIAADADLTSWIDHHRR